MSLSLKIGEVIDNQNLCKFFHCGPQGGMRRSLKTNTLTLISNHIKSIYNDRWLDGVFHYTGMGTLGNQTLSAQNKTVFESRNNGVEMHLFEVFKLKEYTYQGVVRLVGDPYKEKQPDSSGSIRDVWVFPLETINEKPITVAAETLREVDLIRRKVAQKLSDAELSLRARQAKGKPGSRSLTSKQHERNQYVAVYAKRWANGTCQLCCRPAPFKDSKGEPFLETHHIKWLARGGEDTVANTVALCPNCHRKMHALDDSAEVKRLSDLVAEHISSSNLTGLA